MELSADLLSEITGCFGVRFERYRNERRKTTRLHVSAPSLMILLANDKPQALVNVRIRDLSSRGVGILCTRKLPLGSRFLLRLPRHDGTYLWLNCIVARRTPASDDLICVGAKFIGRLGASPEDAEAARIQKCWSEAAGGDAVDASATPVLAGMTTRDRIARR